MDRAQMIMAWRTGRRRCSAKIGNLCDVLADTEGIRNCAFDDCPIVEAITNEGEHMLLLKKRDGRQNTMGAGGEKS